MALCCQYSDLKPGGGFRAFHRVLVYLCGESGTEPSVTPRSGWSPLTDRWCIGRLWENGRCTQVLVNPFCSGAELYEWYCTGRSGVPLIGSCHISASVTKQVCCERSCPGGPVWTQAEVTVILVALHSSAYWLIRYCTGHGSVSFSSFCLFVCFLIIINFLDYFWFNFGFSVKELLPDFLSNMHLGQLGSNPANMGDRCSLNHYKDTLSDMWLDQLGFHPS